MVGARQWVGQPVAATAGSNGNYGETGAIICSNTELVEVVAEVAAVAHPVSPRVGEGFASVLQVLDLAGAEGLI